MRRCGGRSSSPSRRDKVWPSVRISATSAFRQVAMAFEEHVRFVGPRRAGRCARLAWPASHAPSASSGVAEPQTGHDLVPAALVEAFITPSARVAEHERWVDLALWLERLVLDSPAHLVEGAVGRSRHVERIGPLAGGGKDAGAVRGERCRSGRAPRRGLLQPVPCAFDARVAHELWREDPQKPSDAVRLRLVLANY